jgi:deazaflavin-dependent oxidoreductase (nitroreductase family)
VKLYRDLFVRLGRYRWFSWLTRKLIVPLDRYLYRRSDGRFSLVHFGGDRAVALPTLLLITTGRKTGQRRPTAVLYLDETDRLVVVGSNFGQPNHPAWSANLLANPEAEVVVRGQHRKVKARLASEDEKASLWPRLLEIYPTWQDYTHRTDRSFRAFYLESAPGAGI